jgi:RimJ/RimL family protein N-acetyltransferase
MHPVEVTGWRGRLRLREFEGTDAAALHRVYGDPVATRYLSFEPRSAAEVELIVQRILADACAVPRREYALAVELTPAGRAACAAGGAGAVGAVGGVGDVGPDDAMVGMARLAVGDHRSGQIGFALRADRWHQGFGTEAARALLELAFGRLRLHRVWGARSPSNEASARLMTRLGMLEEGRIRHHVFVRGAWRDSVVHSILEDEWMARRAS